MANFTLTAGADMVLGGPGDDVAYGTAATLNAGDSLTGGTGTDVLALVGSGNVSTSSRVSPDLRASGSITRQSILEPHSRQPTD